MSGQQIAVERVQEGQALLAPHGSGWESGGISNAAITFLRPHGEHEPVLRQLLNNESVRSKPARIEQCLREGALVLLYEARPAPGEQFVSPESAIGLAVFTPTLELVSRYPHPVVPASPQTNPHVDPVARNLHITWIHGKFWVTYCGLDDTGSGQPRLFMGRSANLIQWEKMGQVAGELQTTAVTDGVLFPEPVNGEFVLMHSSSSGDTDGCIHLATSSRLEAAAPWRERGVVLSPIPQGDMEHSLLTPGSAPIALGDRRFLLLYNLAGWMRGGQMRRGTCGAAILNLQHPRLDQPESVLESALDPVLFPDAHAEITGSAGGSANMLISCGMFERNDRFGMIYSSGGAALHAAWVPRDALIQNVHAAPPRVAPSPGANHHGNVGAAQSWELRALASSGNPAEQLRFRITGEEARDI